MPTARLATMTERPWPLWTGRTPCNASPSLRATSAGPATRTGTGAGTRTRTGTGTPRSSLARGASETHARLLRGHNLSFHEYVHVATAMPGTVSALSTRRSGPCSAQVTVSTSVIHARTASLSASLAPSRRSVAGPAPQPSHYNQLLGGGNGRCGVWNGTARIEYAPAKMSISSHRRFHSSS